MPKKMCCYCGINQATTRDHIPPKSIFDTSKPINLITVPSCEECNNKAANDDEKFKVYLLMHCAKENEYTSKLFREKVIPTTARNKKLKNKIVETSKTVKYFDKNTNSVKNGYSIQWDNNAFEAVIERLTRGLYYYHFKRSVPQNCEINIYWFGENENKNTGLYFKNKVGETAFNYEFDYIDDVEFASIWKYKFYNTFNAGAFIKP